VGNRIYIVFVLIMSIRPIQPRMRHVIAIMQSMFRSAIREGSTKIMKNIKTTRSKRKYAPPVLAKYDSLNKITLGSHTPRGPCPNYPDFNVTASCDLKGRPTYNGGEEHGCC
jgi:hypothetical protein